MKRRVKREDRFRSILPEVKGLGCGENRPVNDKEEHRRGTALRGKVRGLISHMLTLKSQSHLEERVVPSRQTELGRAAGRVCTFVARPKDPASLFDSCPIKAEILGGFRGW